MNSLKAETGTAAVRDVSVTDEALRVELVDGRTVSVPLEWFPRLVHATAEERGNWRLIGSGEGIHWPDLDEDISAANLVHGRPSGETEGSLRRWLDERARRRR